ncbi:MAG: metallophosphoesterase [Campylobacterales bacterium]|nr:metallophosphoesterase [Campylobacterales bacterium]
MIKKNEKLRILHLTDLHLTDKMTATDKNYKDTLIKKLLLYFDTNKEPLDFIICSGDMINNPDEDSIYSLLDKSFIQPLLEKVNLSPEQIFMVPGNHEISQKYRKDYDYIIDGLIGKFKDVNKSNETFNQIINNKQKMGFESFFDYADKLNPTAISKSNNIFRTYNIKRNNNNIGIACLNSSIACVSSKVDKNNLFITEEQINLAYEEISSADIKIAIIHHPLEWLHSSELRDIQLKLFQLFNIVFIGHEHFNKKHYIKDDFDNNILFLYSTSLLQKNNSANGFNIYTYDFYNERLEIDRLIFNKQSQLFIHETGKQTLIEDIVITNKENHKRIKFLNYIYDLEKNFIPYTNKCIITNLDDKILLSDIYTEISFFNYSIFTKEINATKNNEKEKKEISLSTLTKSVKNFVIFGIKEYGKTTILHKIFSNYLDQFFEFNKIPIFLNFSNQVNRNNNLIDDIKSFLACNIEKPINTTKLLESGDAVIIIDNFNVFCPKATVELTTFITKYKNIKIIISSLENAITSIKHDVDKDESLLENFEEVYLHNFNKKNTRELANKMNMYDTKIINKVHQSIEKFHLPASPFISSLMIFLFKEKEKAQTNESLLLELFLDYILEKQDIHSVLGQKFDYENKMNYLSFIATHMLNNKVFNFSKNNLLKVTIDYLDDKKFNIEASLLVDYFMEKTIFINYNNRIEFRFQAFFEFFIAKKMFKDEILRNKILKTENILEFKSEITYYSGLNREDDTFLLRIFKDMNKIITNDLVLENIHSLDLIMKNKDVFLSDIDPDYEPKQASDQTLDNINSKRDESTTLKQDVYKEIIINPTENKIISANDESYIIKTLPKYIELCAKVIKNADEIKGQTKKDFFIKLIHHLTSFINILMTNIEEVIEHIDMEMKDTKASEQKDILFKLESLLFSTIELSVIKYFSSLVITEKLEVIIHEIYKETNSINVKLICLFLLVDLNPKLFINEIITFIDSLSGNYKIILQTIYIKLYYEFYSKNISIDNQPYVKIVMNKIAKLIKFKSIKQLEVSDRNEIKRNELFEQLKSS